MGGSATGTLGANNEATWCDIFPNVPPPAARNGNERCKVNAVKHPQFSVYHGLSTFITRFSYGLNTVTHCILVGGFKHVDFNIWDI